MKDTMINYLVIVTIYILGFYLGYLSGKSKGEERAEHAIIICEKLLNNSYQEGFNDGRKELELRPPYQKD